MYGDRLKQYCNQIAVLERVTEPDEWGTVGHEPPETIKVRKEAHRKLIRDAEGNTVVSGTTVFSTVEIRTQDRIDGVDVISVGDWVTAGGVVVGWEAYL